MNEKVIRLPDDFIGKDDEARLESFGGHLIAGGLATRWHWRREAGIDVAFEVFYGGADERPLLTVTRDRERDAFVAKDGAGRVIAEGTLDRVMASADELARAKHGKPGRYPA
jgi:hypothetical protein